MNSQNSGIQVNIALVKELSLEAPGKNPGRNRNESFKLLSSKNKHRTFLNQALQRSLFLFRALSKAKSIAVVF